MKKILTLLVLASLISCQSTPDTPDLRPIIAETTAELTRVQAELTAVKENENYALVHTVYLKLKPEITKEQKAELHQEIKKLEGIEVLKDLQIGAFADLGDARAMSDLQMVFQMGFDSEEDYKNYQNHAIHLGLKKVVGQYLAGPAVTYDFWLK